jgi:hypothetical protein
MMSLLIDRQAVLEGQPDLMLYWVSLADPGGAERTSRAPFVPSQYGVFIDITQVFVCVVVHVYDRAVGGELLLRRNLEEGVLVPGERVLVILSEDGRTLCRGEWTPRSTSA